MGDAFLEILGLELYSENLAISNAEHVNRDREQIWFSDELYLLVLEILSNEPQLVLLGPIHLLCHNFVFYL